MAKKETIVSFSAEELDAKLVRGKDKTDWARVDAKTEEELAADMASDPAWEGVPGDWVSRGRLAFGPPVPRGVMKRQVTMRFDTDILDYFKGQGRGWQTRMNTVLRSFMVGDSRKAGEKTG